MSAGNLLAPEASPYLRQHADDPVHWHPWGDAAFERARAELDQAKRALVERPGEVGDRGA